MEVKVMKVLNLRFFHSIKLAVFPQYQSPDFSPVLNFHILHSIIHGLFMVLDLGNFYINLGQTISTV